MANVLAGLRHCMVWFAPSLTLSVFSLSPALASALSLSCSRYLPPSLPTYLPSSLSLHISLALSFSFSLTLSSLRTPKKLLLILFVLLLLPSLPPSRHGAVLHAEQRGQIESRLFARRRHKFWKSRILVTLYSEYTRALTIYTTQTRHFFVNVRPMASARRSWERLVTGIYGSSNV